MTLWLNGKNLTTLINHMIDRNLIEMTGHVGYGMRPEERATPRCGRECASEG